MELEEAEDFIIDAIYFWGENRRKLGIGVVKQSWLDFLLRCYLVSIVQRSPNFFFFFDEPSQAVSLSRKRWELLSGSFPVIVFHFKYELYRGDSCFFDHQVVSVYHYKFQCYCLNSLLRKKKRLFFFYIPAVKHGLSYKFQRSCEIFQSKIERRWILYLLSSSGLKR